jgi:hypothetical protein
VNDSIEQLKADLEECRLHLARLYGHAAQQSRTLSAIARALRVGDYVQMREVIQEWERQR